MRRLELFTSQINTYYRELLECNVSTSIHQRHLLFLLTEIYKSPVNPITPDSCGTSSEKGKFHINWEKLLCFTFHLQGRQTFGQTLQIFVAH